MLIFIANIENSMLLGCNFEIESCKTIEKPLDVCKKALLLKVGHARRRRNSAYYNSSKCDLAHLRLLYAFQMNFAFSVLFSAYYNASKWICTLFARMITVVFEFWSKITLVFIAKVGGLQISAYYSRFS